MRNLCKKEIANVLTHGIGLIIFIVLTPFLLYKSYSYNSSLLFPSLLFSLGLLLVYGFSTTYHYFQQEKIKKVLRIFDHSSIYFLIAGTQSPIIYRCLPHKEAILFLTILWSIVAIGVIFKIFFTGKYEFVSVLSYILLAFISFFAFDKIFALENATTFKILLIIGGLAYLKGIIFYAWKRYTYHHAIWHVFVFTGSICHFIGIYQIMQ
jgi:hemolysin III